MTPDTHFWAKKVLYSKLQESRKSAVKIHSSHSLRTVRNKDNADRIGLSLLLNVTHWPVLNHYCITVDDMWTITRDRCADLIEEFVPEKIFNTLKQKSKYPYDIKRLQRTRLPLTQRKEQISIGIHGFIIQIGLKCFHLQMSIRTQLLKNLWKKSYADFLVHDI